MPANRFTRKATTPKLKRQWTHVYDGIKAKGGSPGAAIRQANAVVRKNSRSSKRTAGRR